MHVVEKRGNMKPSNFEGSSEKQNKTRTLILQFSTMNIVLGDVTCWEAEHTSNETAATRGY
jgi:hypothetical protein